MNERELRQLIGAVKHGKLSRRAFAQRVLAVGLTAPMATQLLAIAGVAHAQPKSQYKPTKRGGGGLLKVLWWQGPTLLNPHFAVGTKDQDGSRVFYEPLAVMATMAKTIHHGRAPWSVQPSFSPTGQPISQIPANTR